MESVKKTFIELAIERKALKFGEFTLKSGRISPYFFNAGLFSSGLDLAKVGDCYAHTLKNSGAEFDMLFGPAYKGIPLACATGISFANLFNRDLPYCYNRKEAKKHGEGGSIVGASLKGRVMIVDDVITAGTAIRESIDLINQAGAEPAGVVVALDRQERGNAELSAIQEIVKDYNIKVYAIINLGDLQHYMKSQPQLHDYLSAVKNYRDNYGISVSDL